MLPSHQHASPEAFLSLSLTAHPLPRKGQEKGLRGLINRGNVFLTNAEELHLCKKLLSIVCQKVYSLVKYLI